MGDSAARFDNAVFGDYSRYYDLLYADKDYEAEVKYINSLLDHFGSGKRVLEFGSGTGRHASLLAEYGYEVTGVERSSRMADEAERRAQSRTARGGSFRCLVGDACTAKLAEQFDAILSLFHVVSYQTSDESVDGIFNTARYHLRPRGAYIFDVWHAPAVLTRQPDVRIKRAENDLFRVTRIAEPNLLSEQNCVRVDYTLFAEDCKTGHIEQCRESHLMRYFSQLEIRAQAARHGLEVVHAEEWMTGAAASSDTWGVCYVARRLD